MKLILGDSVDKLKELDDNSIDSIVTDPPYGLSFMGKKWDYDVPSQEIWEECMRVLKPGGHLLSFAGSRTYHRMAVNIENAGFEIRDQIMWIYGSGFPKSHNIGKAVDKIQGNEREVIGSRKLQGTTLHEGNFRKNHDEIDLTKGQSPYEGWGTALKPAHEPIVMARKPLSEKTVVDNVLEWGTGGINIDDSRIGLDEELDKSQLRTINRSQKTENDGWGMNSKDGDVTQVVRPEGRFPANVIFDEEAGKILDEQTGELSNVGSPKKIDSSKTSMFGAGVPGFQMYGDKGGASRFFYCPKTSKTDRNEGLDDKNNHPTVKPTDLMLYLIRLVTPKGGTTLDPFMGSGSTGKAAVRGGFDFIGIEREKDYMEIAEARIQYQIDNPYNEETGKRVEIKKETQQTLNKFFG
jgi:DNA modification methylase